MGKESKLEHDIKAYAEDCGCLFLKFVSPGLRGVPDRILLGPNGRMVFMELKAPKGQLRPNQVRMIERLRTMGHEVEVVNNMAGGMLAIDAVVNLPATP